MKKWNNILFILIFILMLTLPLVTMDLRKDQISEIDNQYLPEIEGETTSELVRSVENYVNARIGFRAQSLDTYQWLNDRLFGILEHPNYIYGKEDHIFYDSNKYITDWQHLNLDQSWADGFAAGIKGFETYAESQGKGFVYLLIPDKKTVYSEYFPEEYLIKGELSRTDQVLSALEREDVNFYWAKDTMLTAKEEMPVNNKKYDAEHWNENGAFVVFQQLYEEIRTFYPQVTPLSAEEFVVGEQVEETLLTSRFRIDEKVPLYTLKESNAIDDKVWLEKSVFFLSKQSDYRTRYLNPTQSDKPKLLVFHDSYLMHKEKFFTEHFSEVTFIHRYNVRNQEVFERYVDLLDPDMIVYENPERSFPINLYRKYTFKD